jgi:hypothetical protein
MHVIPYPKDSAPDLIYLGRNRYGKQAGIALVDRSWEGRRVIRLYPVTTRGTVCEACHLAVAAEAVPALLRSMRGWAARAGLGATLNDAATNATRRPDLAGS